MDYIIGIDNGLNGGMVVIDKKYKLVDKTIMPVISNGSKKQYDTLKICEFLKKYINNCFVFLEKAQPRFNDGKKQCFMTGFGYGLMQGIITSMNLPYQIISPKEWQKNVFNGINADNTKVASVLFCKRMFPLEDWTPTQRSQKEHDGLTDACCIAIYGLRELR